MGAETSVVFALFFLGFLVVAPAVYSSIDYSNNLVKNSQHVQDAMRNAKLQADIKITNVSFSNNSGNVFLNITLKNTGKTTLNASLLSIFVNGIYYGSSYCTSTSAWVPKSSKSIIFYSAKTITVDNSTNNSIAGPLSSMTWPHTVGSGLLNSLLVVGVDIKGGPAQVTNITYAGVPLTRAAFSANPSSNNVRAEIWYLTNPSAGANNIVVNFNTTVSAGAIAGAVSFSGVDPTNPIPTTATNYGSGGNPSNSITTVNANAWIIDTLAFSAGGSNPTPVSPQTLQWKGQIGGMAGAGSTKNTTTAGSQTMSWTASSADWAWVGAEIKPIGCSSFTSVSTPGRIKVVTENGIWDYAMTS